MALTFGQDLDAMFAARHEPKWDEEPQEMDISTVDAELGYAWDELEKGYDRLANAADAAEGFTAGPRIESILHDLEDLQNEIRKVQQEVRSA